ncbi:MAG: hypothetical protein AAGB31_10335 [Bdellovibrio sp.]
MFTEITAAVLYAKGISTIKGVGSKVLIGYLSKQFLEKNPNLEQIVRKSVKEAVSELQQEFPEIEVFAEDQFMSLLNELSSSVIKTSTDDNPRADQLLAQQIYNASLLYHPNESTKRVYAESFAEKFCVRLYSGLLESKQYAGIITAKEVIAASEFREEARDQLTSLKLSVDKLASAIEEKGLEAESFRYDSIPIFEASNDTLELSEKEDQEIVDLFEQIEALISRESGYEDQVLIAKKIIARVPPTNITLCNKAYNTLLSCYLRGSSKEAWLKGLSFYAKESAYRNAYSNVIAAAIYGNLQSNGEALRIIQSISNADLYAFSDKQKNSYYKIAALIHYHSGDREKSKQLFNKCEDKDDTEYLHFLFYLHSKDRRCLIFS